MLRRNPVAMAGLVGLVLLSLSAILAPWLAPYEPTRLDYDHPLTPPSREHWLGTDDLGRDTFSQVLWGGRESLRVGFVGVLIALVGGLSLGLPSGYFGGLVDALLQRLNDILLAFPTILLMLSIVAALGPGLTTIMIALGVALIPNYARLVRASVLSAKHFEYVTAARATGATAVHIMVRHILPNVVGPLIVYTTIALGTAILVTAALSYLGLGAQPPSPEWGAMLNYGRQFIYTAWWMSVFPGLAIAAAVLSVNLLGDGLRDALDPKLRQ
jgi:peptide/nickel transport system permease protein